MKDDEVKHTQDKEESILCINNDIYTTDISIPFIYGNRLLDIANIQQDYILNIVRSLCKNMIARDKSVLFN